MGRHTALSSLLAATSVLDVVLTVLALLAAAWLVVDLFWSRVRRRTHPAPFPHVSVGLELTCLAVILIVAAVCRLAALSAPITPGYWDSTVNTIMVDRMLEGPGFVETMRSLRTPYQGHSYFPHLAALLPVATLAHRVFGPSLDVQAYIGAMFALASIVLAWLVGRVYRGPLFGLVFAAFLATSPAQLLWSRLGGTYLGGVPHILAVVLFGFEAGRRRSVVCAVVAALLTWLSLYNHYQARVCLPLVYVALAAGALRRPRALLTITLQAIVITLVLAGAYAALHAGSLRATLWPSMGGDVGNQGEQTLQDLIDRNVAPSRKRLRQSIDLMAAGRQASQRTNPVWGWGLEHGGMVLAPAVVFGLLGLVVSLVRPSRDGLPLAISVLGLALAVLSEAQVRKLLVFDLGWQFLAAVGLYQVLGHRLLRERRGRTLLAAGVVAYLATSAWGFAAIAVTTLRAGKVEMPYRQFALPLFGDDFDAPRTPHVTRLWERWMHQGYVVVFVNSDSFATNFATYGGVAALSAGGPEYFRPFHPLDWSANLGPSNLADVLGRGGASAVLADLQATGSRGAVWWFERPTRWDQWLVDELAERGGVVHRWPPTPSDLVWGTPSTYVVFDAPSLAAGVSALEALDVRPAGGERVCLELARKQSWKLPSSWVDGVVRWRHPGRPDGEWVVLSPDGIRVGNQLVRPPRPSAGVAVGETELAVIDGVGMETTLTIDERGVIQQQPTRLMVPISGAHVGANCAARVGHDWWLVDPLAGRVFSNHPTEWLPRRPWVGVTGDGTDRLVLASADQHVAVVRPATRQVREFPARVWGAYRPLDFGSCPVIRLLDDHVASFGASSSLLALYSMEGEEVATIRLAPVLPRPLAAASAIAVSDGLLVMAEPHGSPVAHVYEATLAPGRPECEHGVRLTRTEPERQAR